MHRYLLIITGALFCQVLFLGSIAEAAGNLTRNSSRECAICHFRWIDQFIEGHGTALSDYEVEDVAGDEMICFSCHDGSTEDSRRKVWLMDKHKTGMQPSDKVKIPKLFPLSHDGRMICATCHSAHSNPTDTSIERSIFLRITNNDSVMCEMCHIAQLQPKENHPVHQGKEPLPEKIFTHGGTPSYTDVRHVICESCHTAHGGVERNLVYTMRRSALCILCHAEKLDDPEGPVVEQVNHSLYVSLKLDQLKEFPLQTGENNSLQCLSCHKMHQHAPETKGLITQKQELCTICHADKQSGPADDASGGLNHPVGKTFQIEENGGFVPEAGEKGTVQCFSCHRIHQHAPGTKGLPVQRDLLCSACHADRYLVEKTDHDLRVTAPGVNNHLEKNAEQEGVCISCHVPHKASGPFLWSRGAKDIKGGTSGLCLDCHNDSGPGAKKQVGRFTHPVGVSVKNNPELPLYPGVDDRPVMECHTCHDPHRWQAGVNSAGQGVNVEGDCINSFLRKIVGGPDDLCSTCHNEQYRVTGTDHDLRVTAPAEKNIAGKGIVQAGVCSSCHVPHNGDGPAMWAKPLAEEHHSPSRLCLSCHFARGTAAAKTVGRYSHPVGAAVRGPSKLPLFERDETTTVMECETCHNPHSWSPEGNNIGSAQNIEGDGSNSFLREENFHQPRLCAECHKSETNVTGTDHDMRITAPGSLDLVGRRPEQGTVCAPCHAVHNAASQPALWNRPLSSSRKDFMARTCYSCHSVEGAGKEKQVAVGSHPERYYFGYNQPYRIVQHYVNEIAYEYPLFDREGHQTPLGEISCPTCHDPHVWYPEQVEPGPGANIEGTPVNSFLRKNVRRGLCYTCHGIQTLFLYRYFHVEEERRAMIGPYSPSNP